MNPAGDELARELPESEEERPGQARARLFTMLAFLWIFPSLGALAIIGGDFLRWFDSPTILEGLGRIRFEQWIALGLLVLQALFVVFAIRNRTPHGATPAAREK
ncbi:MAG: hypothetical protein ABI651_11595 [Verrucomicrobiota bacterium]